MRIVFMGTPESAVPSLERLLTDGHEVVAVWTQPDKPAGRGDKVHAPAIKQFALEHSLPVEQPTKIKTSEAKELFASHNADVAVVVAYGRILPPEFLRAPRRGCINVHFSLLPLYRGAAPANWAIITGEARTGVTTMFIEQELDSGPILRQRETQIGETETAPELMRRLAVIGADLLGETLAQLDGITPRPQHDQDATFAPILTKQHGLIDWSNNAATIERCVRGFQPWPNAYTHHKSQRLIIWQSSVADAASADARTGEVLLAHGDDLVVKCGDETALRLLEVQPEAKRRMSVRDFLNGSHLKVGDRFGEV
ncbi:MAG TPA: methionyl-tRNA formyltransferase [Pyrinomonadaceae bacterium]|jgi:methionyl-tRNA formyltransferase|nr:methionyl-tRNA formyltransferase [Pyrinomonadaceae bacterium]